jgi:hypothetical protein
MLVRVAPHETNYIIGRIEKEKRKELRTDEGRRRIPENSKRNVFFFLIFK